MALSKLGVPGVDGLKDVSSMMSAGVEAAAAVAEVEGAVSDVPGAEDAVKVCV
jgi:hypothetical protein